jgi:CRISPR/Cas system-associated exonuclease Cas4 (RecB family)
MEDDFIAKPFDYTLSVQSSWPPSGWPKPPFGPTTIEVMRSCPLRSCFDFSPGYERRMGVAARIGTTMHKTISSVSNQPIDGVSSEIIAAEVSRRFNSELELQKAQAAERPREACLLWDPVRVDRALEATIAEAIRIHRNLPTQHEVGSSFSTRNSQLDLSNKTRDYVQVPIELPAFEVPVQSKDLLFRGRIDRAERIPEGTRLVDYKSAFRDDLPERYTHQIQLYAYLWYETTGEWPKEGQIFYPLKGTFYQVNVTEVICRQVVAEDVELIYKLQENKRHDHIAKPGDTCKVCDYRPWCQSFWIWQNSEKILIKAKEKAAIGFEGLLNSISLSDHYWRLMINWRGITIRLIVPQERFPHLTEAKTGQSLRFLDTPLKGALNQPTVQVFDNSEIFRIL